MTATDLVAWTKLIGFTHDPDTARCEIAAFRYRIPGNGVAEVVATVTAVGPRQPGYVTVWPSLTVRPGTSNQNFQAGQNIATTVVVPLGGTGRFSCSTARMAAWTCWWT
jgi:hypothetical protein